MENIDKSITEMVRSGKYYEDAYEWYADKYLKPSSQRSILALFVLFAVVINYFAFDILSNIDDKNFNPSAMVYIDDTINKRLKLIEPNNIDQDSALAIAEYFLKIYIKKYESYNYSDFQTNNDFIKKYSNRAVLSKYYKYTQLSNIESPINIYQQNGHISVENVKVDFIKNDSGYASQAKIDALLSYYNANDNSKSYKASKKIYVEFFMTDIEEVLNKQKSLVFQIRDYRIIK